MSEKFWLLTKTRREDDRAEWNDDKMGLERVTCSTNPEHRRSGGRTTDLSVFLPSTRLTDCIWTWYSELMVQDHVLTFLRDHRLTGFTVKKVQARFKKPTSIQPPRLWEIEILGWGGMASDNAGLETIEYCPACQHRVFTVANPAKMIDPTRWDGSDFFMVWPLPSQIFVSDKAASLLRNARFSGIKLLPAEEILIEPGSTLTPGRLSYCMPKDRAELLGGPLGIA